MCYIQRQVQTDRFLIPPVLKISPKTGGKFREKSFSTYFPIHWETELLLDQYYRCLSNPVEIVLL